MDNGKNNEEKKSTEIYLQTVTNEQGLAQQLPTRIF